MDMLYVVQRGTPAFEANRAAVDIVCAGDSLTGWNNFGPVDNWPYATYPQFLQDLCRPLGLRVANGGVAGEVSDNGLEQIHDYLRLFSRARLFVMGMGTNDLGTIPDTELASRRILDNLRRMVQAALEAGRQPIVFNVPHVNERLFPSSMATEIHAKREYHNPRLETFCRQQGIPLADICSKLSDQHFGDALHPNAQRAGLIAQAVFEVLPRESFKTD